MRSYLILLFLAIPVVTDEKTPKIECPTSCANCENGICRCVDNFRRRDNGCEPVMNVACKNDRDCVGLKHGTCRARGKGQQICRCQPGFRTSGDKCEQVWRTSCAKDVNVCTHFTVCSSYTKKCECMKGYREHNGGCIQTLGAVCTADARHPCSLIDRTVCTPIHKTLVCRCQNGFYLANGTCQQILGKPCKADDPTDPCQLPYHMSCTGSTCECDSNFRREGHECVAKYKPAPVKPAKEVTRDWTIAQISIAMAVLVPVPMFFAVVRIMVSYDNWKALRANNKPANLNKFTTPARKVREDCHKDVATHVARGPRIFWKMARKGEDTKKNTTRWAYIRKQTAPEGNDDIQ